MTGEHAIGETVSVAAVTTAPAANTDLVTIAAASLPAGRYLVECWAGYGGTAGASQDVVLRRAATNIHTLYLTNNSSQAPKPPQRYVVDLDGTQALVLRNLTLTAGAVYHTVLMATQIRS